MAIDLQTEVSLKPYNTFGLDVIASHFATVKSVQDFIELKKSNFNLFEEGLLIIGGGSNLLLSKNVRGIVVKNEIKGVEIEKQDESFVWVKAGGGEVWNDFVIYTVDKGWAGLENLSLIPGTVGAAPMQNIGAYGTEIKDCFEFLEALNLQTLEVERFDAGKCHFGYRESFFKHEGKGKYLITSVCFKLSKNPQVNTSYGVINDVLAQKGISTPGIKDVSNAVIEIRQSKLPDPKEIGNSGSFFKNPTLSKDDARLVQSNFPNIPFYPVEGSSAVKFPAGWLIEQSGWKGYRKGDAGVHVKQALVLVNYGSAKGQEIIDLSEEIKHSVKSKFGIQLETEVNIL
jgi:UDP-N-acetylmuramate dehydrogenase